MVLIELDEQDPNSKEDKKLSFYIDKKLKESLEKKIIPEVSKKDEDCLFIVDGNERSGKSVFAMQLGKFLDNSLNLSRVCMNPTDFRNEILKAKKGMVIIFDEGYRGLSSRMILSEINHILTNLMMEMGQKNLYVIVVLPTFYLLDRYVSIFRSRGLFHIYKRKNEKGFWRYYNRKKKVRLYNDPKTKKVYAYPRISTFRGRFYNKYVVNEQDYRNKKDKALKDISRVTKSEKYIEQRNKLIYVLYKECGFKVLDIEQLLKKYEIDLKKSMVSDIINRLSK
jgi:hypothetical protein